MKSKNKNFPTFIFIEPRIEKKKPGILERFRYLVHGFEKFLGTIEVQLIQKEHKTKIDPRQPVFLVAPENSISESDEKNGWNRVVVTGLENPLELPRAMICPVKLNIPSNQQAEYITIGPDQETDIIVEKLFQKFWKSRVWQPFHRDRYWGSDHVAEFTSALYSTNLWNEKGQAIEPYTKIFEEFPEVLGIAFGWSANPLSVFFEGEKLAGRLRKELLSDKNFKQFLTLIPLEPLLKHEKKDITTRIVKLDRNNRLISVRLSNFSKQSHDVYWHILLEKNSIRTTVLEALSKAIQMQADNIRLFGHSFLGSLNIKEFYSRTNFERNLIEAVPQLPSFIFFSPTYAAILIRRLAIHYSCYIRETFGTRLSPELLTHVPQMIKNHSRGSSGFDSPSNQLINDIENQAEFLAKTLAMTIMISQKTVEEKIHNSVSETTIWDDSLTIFSTENSGANLPRLGHLLPEDCRPYQRLFIEMFLLDCAGTMPILEDFFKLEKFRYIFKTILEINDEDVYNRLISAISKALDQVYSFEKMKKHNWTKSLWKHRLIGPGELKFTPPVEKEGKKPTAWDLCYLHDLVSRWLRLVIPLEIEALQENQLFYAENQSQNKKDDVPPRKSEKSHFPLEEDIEDDASTGMSKLWEDTSNLLWAWLLFHKQWNHPEGTLSPEKTDEIRCRILNMLNDIHPHKKKKKTKGVDSSEDGLFLHVDSLWLNIYLLWSLFQYLPYPELRKVYFPSSFLAISFIRKLGDLTIYVLWSLINHEQCPEQYAFLPSPEYTSRTSNPTSQLLIDRVRPVNSQRYTEVLIDLIDIYAHYVLKLPFEVHVSRYLNWVLESQAVLYSLKDHYRDHLFHVIDVFLLGDFLLRCRMGRKQDFVQNFFRATMLNALKKDPNNSKEINTPSPDIFQNWCIAGLFHDVGYSFLLYGMIPKALDEHATEILQPFLKGMKAALKGNLENLSKKIEEDFDDLQGREKQLGRDHGAISSLMIRDHLKQLDMSANEEELLSRFTPSLQAIFLHNLSHRPIPMKEFPLGYLLTLCDEIQDWGRHRIDTSQFNRDAVLAVNMPSNWQIRSTPVLTELLLEIENVIGRDVKLRTFGGELEESPRAEINMYQIYKPADPELLDPLLLWVGKTMNLERLQDNQWSRIKLHLVTKVPDRMKRMELTYKDLLSRVAERVPRLNLRRFVHILEQMVQRELDTNPRNLLETLKSRLQNHQIDIAVLNLDKIAEEHPLRAFDQGEGFQQLVNVKKEILREIEERYRFQGRILWRIGRHDSGKQDVADKKGQGK